MLPRIRQSRFVAAWRESLLHEERRLLLDAVVLGILGALAARVFTLLQGGVEWVFLKHLAGYVPPSVGAGPVPHLPHGAWWRIPLTTTLGGLLTGWLVYTFAPEAEGHGTDAVVRAFHRDEGRLRARIVPVKLLASAVTLGTGGSAGREGPTALLAAAVGAVAGRNRTPEQRRILLLTGAAAGLSAIFHSPIGAALFAIEVLYAEMEFEASALVYTTLAAVVAYAINGLFDGWDPVLAVHLVHARSSPTAVAGFLSLGVISGAVALVLPTAFYRARDLFAALRIPTMLKPALGGALLGLLALAVPQVLGNGYGWLQLAVEGRLALSLLVALVFVKIVGLGLTVGSGGSAGVFAPSLFVGGMLGAALAKLMGLPPASFVVVGMAAVFAGAARVPMATLLMVTEMTGGYQLLVPAATTVMISYVVQTALSASLRYPTLYEAQVANRGRSPAHGADIVHAALELIHARRLPIAPGLGHLDLRDLLGAGIPVDLPDGNQLWIAELGKLPKGERRLRELVMHRPDLEVVAVFREEHTLLPGAGFTLRAKDRLLLMGSADARRAVEALFPPPSATGSAGVVGRPGRA